MKFAPLCFLLASFLLTSPVLRGENDTASPTPGVKKAAEQETGSEDDASAPVLYMQTWKVPRAFLQSCVDDSAEWLTTDPQSYVESWVNTSFKDVEGACASYKKGKLTVIHTKEMIEKLQGYIDDTTDKSYLFKATGKMKKVPLEAALRYKAKTQKEQKRKK